MITPRVLRMLRRLLAESDLVLSNLTDEEMLEFVLDAEEQLTLRDIPSWQTFTIGTDNAAVGYGISPEPTTQEGHMMALQAAIMMLDGAYRGRLFKGELGVSWRSGLESASTISAEKAYREALKGLELQLERLILLARASTAGVRAQ